MTAGATSAYYLLTEPPNKQRQTLGGEDAAKGQAGLPTHGDLERESLWPAAETRASTRGLRDTPRSETSAVAGASCRGSIRPPPSPTSTHTSTMTRTKWSKRPLVDARAVPVPPPTRTNYEPHGACTKLAAHYAGTRLRARSSCHGLPLAPGEVLAESDALGAPIACGEAQAEEYPRQGLLVMARGHLRTRGKAPPLA